MATTLSKRLNRPVPQTEAARADMIRNNDVGYVFKVSEETALRRFLLLGSEGGTFYQNEGDLTDQGIALVRQAATTLAPRTYADIVTFAAQHAPKRSYALFALAVGLSTDDAQLKEYSRAAVISCTKTGTDLFELISYIEALRGWGPTARKAVNEILLGIPVPSLALWAVKYRDRHGWTWRDALRIAHPKRSLQDDQRGILFDWMLGKHEGPTGILVVDGYEKVQKATSEAEVIEIVKAYGLPWEALRDEQRTPAVWKQCLPFIGNMAVLRNLATFTRNDLKNDETFSTDVRTRLEKASNLHPITLLNAGRTYAAGGTIGRSTAKQFRPHSGWLVGIENALENSFTRGVTSTGKRFYLGVDCSPSMGSLAAGSAVLRCRDIAAALALAVAKNEPNSEVNGFTSGGHRQPRYANAGYSRGGIRSLGITEKTAFLDAIERVQMSDWGGTDCALPMLDAIERKLSVDVFVVITDNETNANSIHPFEALKKYRKASGINAKLAVVALTSTKFSIADPTDPYMMDFCGYSSDLPKALELFATI